MSKEHAYAYDAGYRDGAINYELEHCPACKNVADLQEALEENAKLREERREYQTAIDSLVDECTDHKDENAKLRQFAAHMANALGIDSEWRDTSWCDTDCMVEFGCQTAYCGGETRCPAWAKLRELGVVK